MRDVNIQEILHQGYSNLIDVRSPREFARDTIPGACNVPLFSDEERAQIGITYKQQGQAAAQWLGMQLVSPKIELLMQTIKGRAEETGEIPTIFCWRGGMRSRAMATFSTFAGLEVQRLTGGYRAYRKYVTQTFEPYELKAPLVLVHGMTGVGKTTLLQTLEASGQPVLDLERMAGHRGSVFGHLGKGKPANQKMFDARLFEGLRRLENAPYIIMEAESKRIGNATLPEFLLNAKTSATIHLLVQAPLDVRVCRLYEDYVAPFKWRPDFQSNVLDSFQKIYRKIPTDQANLIKRALLEGDYSTAIASLLVDYYDPRYSGHSGDYQGEFLTIDGADLHMAEQQVRQFLQERFSE
ncbi:tRNA 2-selenouridine(34) synthase MnmH [Brevibacillus ginsengisoli]|uniref:tRNA 2-selenouridine(34) synthase MnmH n=1 Tax=Brevibacillus ginsengisoli TaxID=363854 RepID=UPI003CFA1749